MRATVDDASVEIEDRERELLEAIWTRIPRLGSDVLGEEVSLSSMTATNEMPDPEGMYVATLNVDGPSSAHAFLLFEVESAIAFGGLLVMMQEKIIREKMTRRDMSEDDFDAMGECVNQLSSAFNESLRETMGSDFHARFAEGVLERPEAMRGYEGERVICASGKMKVAGLHEGRFFVVVPKRLFTGEAAPVDATSGLELTPEEAEAIRAAAREGFAGVADSIVVLLAVGRPRAEWEAVLGPTGLELSFAKDVFETRKLAREGRCGLVIVDADVAPSGGLPALASLRSAVEVSGPLLIAASEPTRTHLVACMAAGAATYLVKPITMDGLRERLEEVAAGWSPAAATP